MAFVLAGNMKETLWLVTFAYGNPVKTVRYVNWPAQVPHPLDATQVFEPMVEMEVKLGKLTGILKEPASSIQLARNAFSESVSDLEPHSNIYVKIEEVTQNADETTLKTLTWFVGRVTRAVRAKNGKTRTVWLEIVNMKARFDSALGLVAGNQCVWTFGRKGCDPNGTSIDIESLKKVGTLTTIDAHIVTIVGLPVVRDRYWHRGYLLYDGLPLLIRDWESGTEFSLSIPAPENWLNKSVTVYPGCTKTKDVCIEWDNEDQFCGAGLAMPPYHPILETK